MSDPNANNTGFDGFWSGSNTVNQQDQNEQIVRDDPDGTKAAAAESSVYLWNPNALNTQGLFPKRFPSTISSYQQLVNLIRDDMSYQERLAFKRKLWSAGFYSQGEPGSLNEAGGSGYSLGANLKGDWNKGNNADEEALKALFNRYAEENKNIGRSGQALDLDTIFTEQLLEQSSETREGLISNYGLQGLYVGLQNWALENLGREFKEEEAQKLLEQTFAFDQGPGEVSSTTQWAAQNTASDPMTKQQIVIGGGPDSSAINFGRGLAATYSLVVDTAFTTKPKLIGATEEFEDAFQEGRAVKITGDRQRMIKLHEWARTQQSENGVFENVRFVYENNSNEPTGLLLSMREGNQIPPMAMTGFSFGQTGSEIDKFLDSVKRPGDVYAYSWEGDGPNRRGAYGMSDQIWEFYSNQLGIDSGDTSITAQDRVARAYVSDLWERYGSWKEVALALRINEDTANRRAAERQAQGAGYVDIVTDPSELSWADAAIAKMGEWKPVLDTQRSEDLYSSMYGDSLNYVPLNVFAGPPANNEEAKNKSLWLAQKAYAGEINTNNILQDVMKKASTKTLRDFSQLERKWQP